MPYREFQSASNQEAVTFRIGEDIFEAAKECPAGVLLSMAAIAADKDGNAIAGTMDFLDSVLLPSSREKFAERMRDPENPIALNTVTDLVQWLVELYTGRPTELPSPSPAGQPAAGPSSTEPSLATASTS
jgi:hypothetical protein